MSAYKVEDGERNSISIDILNDFLGDFPKTSRTLAEDFRRFPLKLSEGKTNVFENFYRLQKIFEDFRGRTDEV